MTASCLHVGASTALRERPAIVLTGAPDDLSRPVGDDATVRVQPLQ